MDKHYDWIDNLKGIGIILVVFYHSMFPTDSIFREYFASFIVPLFFFISGFLYRQKPDFGIWDYMRSRFNRLIIPYIFFNILTFLTFGVISEKVNYLTIPGVTTFFKNLTFGIYSGQPNSNIANIPTWFLPCLFFTGLFYFLIDKNISGKFFKFLTILIISVLIYLESKYLQFRMPFSMDIALMSLFFYGLGNLFREEIINFTNKINYWYLLLIPLLVSITILFLNVTQMSTNNYGNYFKLLICSFSGIITFLIISKIIGKTFLGFYGENSVIVLCMEWIKGMTYSLFIKLSFHFLPSGPGYISGIVQTISCLLFLIPIIFIIKRYFPFLIGNFKNKSSLDSPKESHNSISLN